MFTQQIPTLPDVPYALGRHIAHDPRSRNFRVATDPVPFKSVRHRRHGVKLDQGSLGACTGYAAAHALNSDPYRKTMRPKPTLQNNEAVLLYSNATKLDPWYGEYPPDDTGSNGLSVCKAMKALGWIREYRWAFGLEDGLNAIQAGPLLQGSFWTENMFFPNDDGRVTPTGRDAGGHEYLWIGVEIVGKGKDYAKNRSWFFNSWGHRWGCSGYFWMSWDNHYDLLGRDGDIVQPVI